MSRVYISGPMTGKKYLNFPTFFAKAAELRAAGRFVVNPCEFGECSGTWSDYLRKDIRALMDCDTIHMLPGWKQSKGATLEHHIAEQLGYTIEGAPE